VEVIERMLALKHLYNWSYADTVRFVSDSLVLRWFCRIYLNPFCDSKTLLRLANLIQPDTLRLANRRLDAIAYELRLTRWRKLRTDGMVVETNIHHPTDSSLLADGVRVLSRMFKRVKAVLQQGGQLAANTLRDRNRSARRAARRIHEASRRSGEEAKAHVQEAYRRLVRITQASVAQARRVLAALKCHNDKRVQKLQATLERFIPRLEQVIAQTRRRVFEGGRCPPVRRPSVSSSRTPISSAVGRPTSRWSSATRSGWMR
jgi:IS5 family transposase